MNTLIVGRPLTKILDTAGKRLVKDIVTRVKEHQFEIFSYDYDDDLNLDNIKVTKVSKLGGSRAYGKLIEKLVILIRIIFSNKKNEIYHFFFHPSNLNSLFIRYLMKLKKAKTIQTLYSTPKKISSLRKICFASDVVVTSNYLKGLCEKEGIKNIIRIYPGTDLELYQLNHKYLKKQPFSQFRESSNVLFAAHYSPHLGIDIVLNSIPRVVSESPDIKFVFACRIDNAAEKRMERWAKKFVQKRSLSDSVIFLDSIDNMKDLLRNIDITIFPARKLYKKMDIPLILLESLAMEVPIIISDIAPLNEIMIDQVGISLFPINSNNLGKAILMLIKDDTMRKDIGRRGRLMVGKYFNVSDMAKQYKILYDKFSNEDYKQNLS